jgi:hypothetical protein
MDGYFVGAHIGTLHIIYFIIVADASRQAPKLNGQQERGYSIRFIEKDDTQKLGGLLN